jgi:hypothetical protein
MNINKEIRIAVCQILFLLNLIPKIIHTIRSITTQTLNEPFIDGNNLR